VARQPESLRRTAPRRRRRRRTRRHRAPRGTQGTHAPAADATDYARPIRGGVLGLMQNPLMQTIEALAKEKGIEPDMIITAIEDAVLTASRKYYKTNENLKTRFNQDTGQVDLFAVKQIVREVTNPAPEISLEEAQQRCGAEAEVDMEIEFPKPTDVLGRIAAQTAKPVIFQKLREAERENIF